MAGNVNTDIRGTAIAGSNVFRAEQVPGSGAGDDSTDLPSVAGGTYVAASMLYVAVGGDVVLTHEGNDLTFAGLQAGVWHPMSPFTRVKATGTTASGMIAGY